MKFMNWLTTLRRKLRNIFFPELMVGRIGRSPVNRKERRAAEAIARKHSRNVKKETK